MIEPERSAQPPADLPNPYRPADSPLTERTEAAQALVARFNQVHGSDPEGAGEALERLIGRLGENVRVRGPLHCDLGENIAIGDGTFVKSGLTALDIAPISIGKSCWLGPNVSLLTPVHPIGAEDRQAGWEGAESIAIGDNVWIGGGATILPGVTIGDGAVIGAGAVVTRDVPAGQVAVGNPARVIRTTESSRRPTVLTALVTCPVEIAEDLAGKLVEAGNAACVNLIDPIRSVYQWQGEIVRDREALLVIKTTRPRIAALEAQLTEIHPYDVHELICLPVESGSPAYLDWVADSVT